MLEDKTSTRLIVSKMMLWEFLYFAGKVCGDAKGSRSPNIMKAITRARTNVKGVFF